MKGLIQRVSEAGVSVDGAGVAEIGTGILLLLGVEKDDDESLALRLCERVLGYRIFPDDSGRMNRSLLDIGGAILIVPQFTLAADTRSGSRPGFSTAAAPEHARSLFDVFAGISVEKLGPGRVGLGQFGADMKVSLVNDGPVTFSLAVR